MKNNDWSKKFNNQNLKQAFTEMWPQYETMSWNRHDVNHPVTNCSTKTACLYYVSK